MCDGSSLVIGCPGHSRAIRRKFNLSYNLLINFRSVFGKVNCLSPDDSRQYLYCLTPKPDVSSNVKQLRGALNIGKLDIVWRTNMGERGRLQTSQLQRMVFLFFYNIRAEYPLAEKLIFQKK